MTDARARMEPIPETARVLDQLDPVPGEADDALLDSFRAAGLAVLAVVPDCLGFSLSRLEDDLVFTMLSTTADVAVLDAAQYLDDGPGPAGVRCEQPVGTSPDDPLNEERWQLFATVAGGLGVHSTLTLPIHGDDGRVSGSVNLYACGPHAFDGHHEELAGPFGAWSSGAVTNADLSFSSRRDAQRAPQVAEDLNRVQVAVGLVAATLGTDVPTARERVRRAADLAGLSEAVLARSLIALVHPPEPGDPAG